MSKTDPAGAVSITIQPQTLTNVTISNGTSTYLIEECTLSVVNGQTIYNFYAGDSSCYPFGAKTTSLTFNADGCQSYTIQDIKAESEWTVIMQPATGYRKLYAYSLSKAAIASQPGTTESTHDYIYLTAETLEESNGIAYDVNGNPWGGTLKEVSSGLAYSKPYDSHSGGSN
jgi:hypothetical protein